MRSISEMIAQIQNGLLVGRNSIAITRNSTTMQVANILLREGYIEAIINSSNSSNFIAVILKYKSDGSPVITGLQRISRPGLRVYVSSKDCLVYLMVWVWYCYRHHKVLLIIIKLNQVKLAGKF